jgi:hypothetical protein
MLTVQVPIQLTGDHCWQSLSSSCLLSYTGLCNNSLHGSSTTANKGMKSLDC